jgi:multidrug efflux pump subunit AcrA (membrane-fusion protein)
MATICVSAIAILHGIGILLVALTMAGLALPLIARSRRFVAAAKISGQPWKWWRPAISALLVSVLLFAPLVPLAPIPGIIVLSVLDPVRVVCPGFIEEVFVKDGDSVTRDQILFRLSNPEQSARLGQLRAANRRAETLALEYARGQRHELQARQEAIAQGLAEQIREASKLVASLELRAPCDGQIVGPRLSDLAGAFERTGKELTSVGHLNSVEVLAAIPQNRLSQIPLTPARRAEAYLPGRNVVISGTVSSFEQSATRQIRKSSLAANSGGPLAVRSSRTSNPSGDIELAGPVVYFSITPNEPQSGWNEGEPVVVRIPGAGRSTLFGEAISNFRRFWDQASHRFEDSP